MKIPTLILSLALIPLAAWPVYAADNATVNATVTLQHVSIGVADGTINYGVLSLNDQTHTKTLSDTQTITNQGNVAVDILIKGQHSDDWSLHSSAGTDTYVHRFCNETQLDCATPITNYSVLTTNNQTLGSAVAPSGTIELDLHLTTPTASTFFTQQNVDVIITAVAS